MDVESMKGGKQANQTKRTASKGTQTRTSLSIETETRSLSNPKRAPFGGKPRKGGHTSASAGHVPKRGAGRDSVRFSRNKAALCCGGGGWATNVEAGSPRWKRPQNVVLQHVHVRSSSSSRCFAKRRCVEEDPLRTHESKEGKERRRHGALGSHDPDRDHRRSHHRDGRPARWTAQTVQWKAKACATRSMGSAHGRTGSHARQTDQEQLKGTVERRNKRRARMLAK